MFEGWANFYLMIGGASGALIGLMFVVATLTGNVGREQSLRGASLYMTPTVVTFSVVLGVSALTAVPGLAPAAVAEMLGIVSAAGALYGASILWRLLRGAPPHWSDYWCYGAGPMVAYLALGGVAAAIAASLPWAAHALAAVLFAALLLAINNAWDLVTWLAPVAKGNDQP